MQVVHEVCCGLDVHKKGVTACVLWASGRRRQTRAFGTFTRELLELGDWLRACGVTHVAMESTGVYWKPVWNLLEGLFEVLLVNAQHIKAVPGRKTDQKDSEWIADLLQHGLLRASFVPPTPIRELRDLTRYRASLAQEINRIANRIQKVLEDANIKLASVATDTLGASGRAMLEAMVKGEQDSQRLAEMSKGLLRNKIPELKLALEGRVTAHHRFLLRELLDHLYFVESKMQRVEQEVAERLGPFQSEVARLCTIPGVDRVTAWGLLAEIGLSMKQFPDAQHLASWAGLCPGQSRERRQAQERKDPQREPMVASLPMPRSLGRLDQEEQLFVGSLSSAGSAKRIETRDYRGRPQAPGHCLLHLARRNLLQRPRRRLLRSPEPRRPAQALNQTARRPGLQSDPRAISSSRLEAIF